MSMGFLDSILANTTNLPPNARHALTAMLHANSQRHALIALLLVTLTRLQANPAFNVQAEIRTLDIHLKQLAMQLLMGAGGAGAPPAPTSPPGTLAANQKKAADALAELIRTLSLT